MDDACSLRSDLAEGVNMCHNVMAHFLLALLRHFIINVVDVGFHLVDLLLCNRQTKLLLSLRERNPKTAPGGELHIRREDIQHLRAGVTGTKADFRIRCSYSLNSFPGAGFPRATYKCFFYFRRKLTKRQDALYTNLPMQIRYNLGEKRSYPLLTDNFFLTKTFIFSLMPQR